MGGGACGIGSDAGSLKETLAVTFIKRIHLILSAVMRFEMGVSSRRFRRDVMPMIEFST